jgi:hypothetical protein
MPVHWFVQPPPPDFEAFVRTHGDDVNAAVREYSQMYSDSPSLPPTGHLAQVFQPAHNNLQPKAFSSLMKQ